MLSEYTVGSHCLVYLKYVALYDKVSFNSTHSQKIDILQQLQFYLLPFT